MSDVGFRVQSQKWRQAIQGLDITRNPKSDIRNPLFYTAPSPGLLRTLVFMVPSVILKIPGNRVSQPLLATGQYCREFASMPATPGTRAAILAECISDAPG